MMMKYDDVKVVEEDENKEVENNNPITYLKIFVKNLGGGGMRSASY